jgi:hypothetical protein
MDSRYFYRLTKVNLSTVPDAVKASRLEKFKLQSSVMKEGVPALNKKLATYHALWGGGYTHGDLKNNRLFCKERERFHQERKPDDFSLG